jgi:hypothetical protein
MNPTPSATLPTAVADIFRPLRQELLDMYGNWAVFRQLFVTDPEYDRLYLRFAPIFFARAKMVFYDIVIQSLFRFTDPPETFRHPNLCLDRLGDAISPHDASLATAVQATSAAINGLLAPHRDWRDHRVAHNNMTTTQSHWAGTSTLTGPSPAEVEEVLQHMGRVLNRVAAHYGEALTVYEGQMSPVPGDASTLVRHLLRLASL